MSQYGEYLLIIRSVVNVNKVDDGVRCSLTSLLPPPPIDKMSWRQLQNVFRHNNVNILCCISGSSPLAKTPPSHSPALPQQQTRYHW